jgi:sigma-B regulation protein RsbU (phosphoserine phosphatase)
MFVTIFYGVLDTRNGTLEYSNGGHNPPYILSKDGDVTQVENVGGLFVGALKDIEYESKMMTMQPGDTLFLYTDGVTEAEDINEEEFETERLESTLKAATDASLAELTQQVFDAVHEFSQGKEQTDDITTLAVRYNG